MVAHAHTQLPIELLEKSFLPQDTGKLGSKFGEDRSTSEVTILSTDAGRTDGRLRDFIFCPMHMHSIGRTNTWPKACRSTFQLLCPTVYRLEWIETLTERSFWAVMLRWVAFIHSSRTSDDSNCTQDTTGTLSTPQISSWSLLHSDNPQEQMAT